jgi:hypothetical protein
VPVNYGLAEFHTGDRILALPVMEGASWASMLNKADSLSCSIDLRDPDVQALDIVSATEPEKTVLFAETPDGTILAWGVITGDREWNDDERSLAINAVGVRDNYFGRRIIAPPGAADGELFDIDGKVTTAYDTLINDVSLGSIGVALVEQALSWSGAPTAFELPAPIADVGRTSGTYRLVDYKSVASALDDLTKRAEGGPDFAFDARRTTSQLALEYVMRAGAPYLGTWVGSWAVGAEQSPVTGLRVVDNTTEVATHIWMQSGRTDSKVLIARARNDGLLGAAGYPVLDLVDTTHTDVVIQETLDEYAAENAELAAGPLRTYSFNVRGDATPALGSYRPGDWVGLDVADGNLYLAEGRHEVRITAISGDETGTEVKIETQVGSAP